MKISDLIMALEAAKERYGEVWYLPGLSIPGTENEAEWTQHFVDEIDERRIEREQDS